MNETSSSLDLSTLWVEYKNPDGRIYYYNAKTRQTTWTKPEGQRVMSQSELDQLLASQSDASKKHVAPIDTDTIEEETESIKNDIIPSSPTNDTSAANYNPYSYPPPTLGMPFGTFPPHLMPHMAQIMQNNFPGFGSIPPPAHLLRFMMPPFLNPTGLTAGKTLETLQTELKKLRVQLKELEGKMEKINNEASVWSEFKNPEGRPYYYNSKTTESTWDKPIVLNDVIDFQNQLEHVNKTIHESEKEAKRLESEQSQLAAVTATTTNASDKQPQQAAATPAFINGFTLEKLDNNEMRRFGESGLGADRNAIDDKSKGKARPVSTKPISGTPWCIVWTSDQQVFFFNPTSRISLWDRPEELKGRMDVDEMIQAALPQDDQTNNNNNRTTATKQKLDSTPDGTEPETKKLKSEPILATNTSNGNDNHDNEAKLVQHTTERLNITQESSYDAETKAAKQRELIPYETRIKQFREMLAEKQVSAFTTWEQEKSKIDHDLRFSLLSAKERKQEFDRYTHERADEERREKEAKIKLKKQEYRDLLIESNVSIKTTFTEFSARHSKDERFRAIEKIRDREAWFHDYMQELKIKEKQGSSRHSDKEKLKKDYFSLLKELKVTRNSSWSDTKHSGEHDSRYRAIESSSRREDWFREYQSKHIDETTTNSNETNEENIERQREKDKQNRIDASIKKRAEEVKEQLSGFQRELDKEREQLKKDKAIENFKALLTDMVRTPDAEWKETKKNLRKDSRWDQDIDRNEKERLFEEHISLLEKKRKTAFHNLLSEHCTLTSSWKDVKKNIKSDPRFEKICSNERKRDLEKEFENYIKDKYQTAKTDFKELLKETKVITYRSLQTIRESEEQNHLRDIEKILQKDKRYLLLDVIPEERSKILMDYLEDIEQRGVPPPPTASVDRRKL
ncbi:unnamed protein product [Rotaria socialis]|uniref:Transcription elongation regulator 1 n=1 Tax=Rotaria socialis TaxID=392032 RepID=A0A818EEJ2_9BILA|nr:unnamed protein product [Rotaria socialis]CAF3457533.1 unnamed protein product [Rotaria socialis]CAF4339919.1 unnamed protein product [Rotaria socialis]CAF4517035.1 unnamed protein product [Rotaria socialis]